MGTCRSPLPGQHILRHGGLAKRINDKLATLDVDDVRALAEAGALIRHSFVARHRALVNGTPVPWWTAGVAGAW